MDKEWLGAPLIKKRLGKVQKMKRATSASLAGARLRARRALVGVQGAKPPEALVFFSADYEKKCWKGALF